MLVKVLTGVFDPPPASIPVPWGYLTVLAALVLGLITLVVVVVVRRFARPNPSRLREL